MLSVSLSNSKSLVALGGVDLFPLAVTSITFSEVGPELAGALAGALVAALVGALAGLVIGMLAGSEEGNEKRNGTRILLSMGLPPRVAGVKVH